MPAPISDLVYQLDERGVTLSWSPPTRSEQGKHLSDINSFVLERAMYNLDAYCESCPVNYHEIATVSGDDVGLNEEKITYREENLRPGYIYFFRVKTSLGWRVVSRSSQPVSFRWQLPMAAPADLRVLAENQKISLNWQAPKIDLDGQQLLEPLYYQIYRSVDGEQFTLFADRISTLEFNDHQVKVGGRYQYKVRATRESGGTGVFSDQLEVTLRDLMPPTTPRGLSLIRTPAGVRLFWEPVADDDLAGYQILRRFAKEHELAEDFEIIGQVAASTTSFIDKTCKDQQTCYYALKAFDSANPANESPLSDEIKMMRKK